MAESSFASGDACSLDTIVSSSCTVLWKRFNSQRARDNIFRCSLFYSSLDPPLALALGNSLAPRLVHVYERALCLRGPGEGSPLPLLQKGLHSISTTSLSLSRGCACSGNEPAALSARKKIGFPGISREEFFNTHA